METVLGFFAFLLVELPARVIGLFPEQPELVIGIAVVVVLLLLVMMRRKRRKRRR